MKRAVLLVALVLCFTFNVFAQDKGEAKQQVVIKTIFAYQKELSLSDKQVQNLKDTLAGFQKYLIEQKKVLVDLQKQLNEMISNATALKQIRKKLEEISRIQVDISYKDVETSRNIEGELSSAQLTKWKGLQLEARKEAQKQAQEAQEKAKKEEEKKVNKEEKKD